ncbi:MAG TPA: phospholipid carrier-dependent glycosyltransferase [bacterium]|nr:phospholipid carrier-dependent glycosyltransferase [bacterium]
MNAIPKTHSPAWFLLFALMFATQIIPRFWGDSLTNDEPLELANGYFYLTQGDVISHQKHPPFSKILAALPLLALNLKEPLPNGDAMDRAYGFFFRENRDRLQMATCLGRLSALILGLGIGFMLYGILRSRPLPILLTGLSLWALDPSLSAFSGLALADLPAAFFFLAAILSFQWSQEGKTRWQPVLTGVLTGMAITCKFSALTLIPVFLTLEWMPKVSGEPIKEGPISRLPKWLWGVGGCGFWIFLLYLPGTFAPGNHFFPFRYFWDGLMEMVHYHNHPVYFMGETGRQNHWAYFPLAFILKSPLPFLLFLGAGLILLALGRLPLLPWQWAPGIIFFAFIIPVQDLGIRYLLPAYPFLILVAAEAFGWFWSVGGGRLPVKIVLASLVLFQGLSVGASYPHAISYFNELIAPERKLFWLGDSNLDISQDLKRLSETQKRRGWERVKLAYLGGSDPSAYGLSWTPWKEEDLKAPQPGEVYAVNASFIQLAPLMYPETRPIASSWLSQATPTEKVNDTWYVFEIPGKKNPTDGRNLTSVPFQQNRGYLGW